MDFDPLYQAAIDVMAEFGEVVIILVGTAALRYLAGLWSTLQGRLPQSIRDAIDLAADIGYNYSKQMYQNNPSLQPAERLRIAVAAAQRRLEAEGYNIDLTVVTEAIEATIGRAERDFFDIEIIDAEEG